MADKVCGFLWYELMTTDAVAAQAFYEAVVGWGAKAAPPPNEGYTLFSAGEECVAGVMQIAPEMCESMQPGWLGYIAVDDVEAYAGRIQAAGGAVLREPDDIAEVGRFAVCADPHGAVFLLLQPFGEGVPDFGPHTAPGTTGWHELHAGNGPVAWEFYSQLFGWTKTGAMDMGELGEYQFFGTGGDALGAMMTKMPNTPRPFWNYYFVVEDIPSAIERLTSGGGQVVMGPHEVPGGSWIVQALDPQGAFFSLVAFK